MSYNKMSCREGNCKRIMEMAGEGLSPGVTAAYFSEWGLHITPEHVKTILETYEMMGDRAVKKADVRQAIETHKRLILPLTECQYVLSSEVTFGCVED